MSPWLPAGPPGRSAPSQAGHAHSPRDEVSQPHPASATDSSKGPRELPPGGEWGKHRGVDTEPVTVSRYLRYPHVRGDLLAFIADDDVWLASAGGGRAWRISADQSAAAYPRISPDGSLIAWTSWRDGPGEIYL